MAEAFAQSARPTDAVGRALYRVCTGLAILGGLICCLMAALVTVSVIGRYLFSAPVPGDYDLVGILSGCAAFAFLPYCQLMRGNVVVDFFTTGASPGTRAALDGFGSFLFLVIAVLFTWRSFFGMLELRATHEVIAAFEFHRWWTLPFDIACLLVLIAVIGYTLARDLRGLASGSKAGGGAGASRE